MPPPFNPVIPWTRKFRFLCDTAVTDQLISALDLINLTFVATGATTGTNLYAQFRIIKVEMWGINSGAALPEEWCTLSMTWLSYVSTTSTAPRTVSDTGNAYHPAHIVSHPPAGSIASMFLAGTTYRTVGPFMVTCDAGTIMDLTLESYNIDYSQANAAGVPAPNALSGGAMTAGYIYNNYLDNSSTAGAAVGPLYWAPVGGLPVKSAYA